MSLDPHSYARPSEARVVHVSLDLAVDFERRRLEGTASLDFQAAPGAREIVLDTRGLVIHAVTGPGGAPLGYELARADPLLGSALTIPLPESGARVSIRYSTGPEAPALDWLAPAQTAGGVHPFLFTQGHAIETRSYVPLQDSPGIRQTYDARISLPRPLTAVMSAASIGRTDAPDGRSRVFSFEMKQPIPAYLIALAAGDLGFRAIGSRTGVFAEPATLERAANEFVELERMMEAAERLGGPYRWDRFDVLVMPPSFPYGGMENPRLTFASPTIVAGDRSLTTVVAHELAHAWAGNLVTNATWNDFWLNEGVTVYLELRMNEALWGAERAEMLKTFGWRELEAQIESAGAASPDTRLRYDMTGRDPAEGVTPIPYLKGAAFFWSLERALGRPRIDRWLRGWFDRRAFTSVTTDTLLCDLDEHLFEGGAPPFDLSRWIDQPGVPADGAPAPSRALDEIDAAAAAFAGGALARSLGAEAWIPAEWRLFLGTLLRAPIGPERLAELDGAFLLSKSGNAEVLFAWLRLAARTHWDPALPAIERFLLETGRGKYLRPLYTELLASEWGSALAERAYAAARPRYHALVRAALDRLLARG
jgi:aminopeptidase N